MSWLRHKDRAAITMLCAACTIAVAVLHHVWAPLRWFDFFVKDAVANLAVKAPRDPDLVFLAIDLPSTTIDAVTAQEIAESPALQLMQRGWPYPREVYAHIIDRLAGAGARVIGIDLLFPTPREGDDLFRAALERHADRVVIGSNFLDAERSGQTMQIHSVPSASLVPSALDSRVGFVNFWPDYDGRVREARYRVTEDQLFRNGGETTHTSLTGRMLEKIGRADLLPPGAVSQPFRFVGRENSFPARSIYEIFVPKIWEGPTYAGGKALQNKIILIGPEGRWSKDYVETPFGQMSGPELHLNALNAALHRAYLRVSPPWADTILIVLAGTIAWALAMFFPRPMPRSLTAIALTVGFCLCAILVHGWWPFLGGDAVVFSCASPGIALLGGTLLALSWEQVRDRVERARMRRTLERYVSKNVVREILDNPNSYLQTLGGERRCVAILFSDLRGFTTLTEGSDSAQLVTQLNEYFSAMVDQIFKYDGTVDKFIGDAIMAVWGNLRTRGPAADIADAIHAAFGMRDCLRVLNEDWKSRGLPTLAMGIGVNYGEAIVGNIGSTEKMEPTVIGDPINLASRLEGLTKEYGLDMLVGETAAKHVEEAFHLQLIDCVQVRGKTKPVGIYRVWSAKSDPLPETHSAYLDRFRSAHEKYCAGEWNSAREEFLECNSLLPNDRVAAIYVARCEQLLREPPAESWTGVFVMNTK
jgi:adenylate cyclase